MDFLTWGRDPWGQEILTRISWDLMYLSLAAGLLFVLIHAVYVRMRPKTVRSDPDNSAQVSQIPERIERHTPGARLFHWVMAASMVILLITAFLPIAGVQFAWVTLHWIAGIVLSISVAYHIIHASIWLDFWSIWPDREDLADLKNRSASSPTKAGKYPIGNKLYHCVIVAAGIATVATGLLMMVRIRTPLWTRDPYLFSDQTWGMIYVLHGLAGVGMIALTMAHFYFALRPEKLWMTRGMIFGSISRRDYLDHHNVQRWVVTRSEKTSA